jgi:hypothetical protein
MADHDYPVYATPCAVSPGVRWTVEAEGERSGYKCPECPGVLYALAPAVYICAKGIHSWHVGTWRHPDARKLEAA